MYLREPLQFAHRDILELRVQSDWIPWHVGPLVEACLACKRDLALPHAFQIPLLQLKTRRTGAYSDSEGSPAASLHLQIRCGQLPFELWILDRTGQLTGKLCGSE